MPTSSSSSSPSSSSSKTIFEAKAGSETKKERGQKAFEKRKTKKKMTDKAEEAKVGGMLGDRKAGASPRTAGAPIRGVQAGPKARGSRGAPQTKGKKK